MKHIKPTKPPAVERPMMLLSYGLGLWAVLLAVAQMVSFEEFVHALEGYRLTGERGSVALAIVLISLEVFAVPFLLRLHLSPLARAASAVCALVLPYAWTILSALSLMTGTVAENAGYFGGFLAIPVGVLVTTLDVMWLTLVSFTFGRLGGTQAFKL